jgi:hypothetical protein
MDLWTPAEMAIHNAIQEVEKMPADVRLTNAVILLSQVQRIIADFIDKVPQLPKEEPIGVEEAGEIMRLNARIAAYQSYVITLEKEVHNLESLVSQSTQPVKQPTEREIREAANAHAKGKFDYPQCRESFKAAIKWLQSYQTSK